MITEINHITLSDEVMPIRLDNLILQKIQDRYGSITDFELKVMGWAKDEDGSIKTVSEPSLEAINWALPEMVIEGYAVEGKECPYTADDINRLVDMTPLKLALEIHEEIARCFERKKKQTPVKTEEKKNLLDPEKITAESTSSRYTFWDFVSSIFRSNK